MASGATISLTGGTTMTQVVAGLDTIRATDFNNARNNVNALLGPAADVELGSFTVANTVGYSQGGAGVSAAVVGELVYADNSIGGFKRLQDDVQSLCAFLGQSLRLGVGVDVTTTDTIAATTWNNLMLNIKDCWDNRFTAANTSVNTANTVVFNSAWGISLEQTTTWTWGTEAECRAFFNAGGGVGASSSRSGGVITPENTGWSDLLSSMGNVFMKYNSTEGTTGTSAGVGFYDLTTSYQLLFTKFGSGAYVNNFFKVEGRINSVTNPTEVSLKYTWSEQYANNIDGTVSLNSLILQPNSNGSTIVVSAGTSSASAISSSGLSTILYTITESSSTVDEGNAMTMNVSTTNFGNGVLYWTVQGTGVTPTTSADFVEDSGNVTITDNAGSFLINTVADLTTEGAETFIVQLRTGSILGNVVSNSNVITINDTSTTPPTYSITPNVFSVDEGNTVTFGVITTDVGNTVLYWNTLGADSADFVEDSGNVIITDNAGSFLITTVADLTTEGAEIFAVELRIDSPAGNVVATSANITINDTSTTLPTYAITPTANTVNENASITFNVVTTDVGNTVLYWTVLGADPEDFVEDSGNVTVTDNAGAIIITTVADLTTEGNEDFALQLRTDSISGTVVATSSNVTIVDTSTTPPTYAITPTANTVNENASITFNVVTTNFGSGTLYWNIIGTGINPASNADFVSHNGNVSIVSDAGSFAVTTVADLTTEGSETFAVQLRIDSPGGNLVATSGNVSINDTSISPPTYTVTANISSVNEGNAVTFNVVTGNFGNGVLYWDTIFADAADFDQSNGNVTVTNDVGSFIVTTVADLTTEGSEVFAVQLLDAIAGNVLATSGNVTINDTSTTPPTYSITPNVTDVDEGNAVTVSVTTTNFGNGVLYWTVSGTGASPTTSADFVADSGNVAVTGDSGSFIVTTVADLTTEGAETFILQLRTDSISGNVVANSNVITINDTSTTPPTYSITPNVFSVDEGNAVTVSVTTTNFGNGVLYWTADGVGASPTSNVDFVADSGNVTITNNAGSFFITTVADSTTEGAETFTVKLRIDSISGNVVANSNVITINDTSTTPPTYAITPSANTVNENASITLNIVTTNFGNGLLYWTADGVGASPTSNVDFVEDSGNVTITNDAGSFVLTTVADLETEGAETFTVNLRTDSISGNVVANTAVITIEDTSVDPLPNVVALHGFGAPEISGTSDIWRVDESENGANIIATGTSGGRYYNSSDATFVDDGNIGTPTSNVLFGSGTFARLSTGGGSVANIAHNNNFIFANAFTVECWARMPTNLSSSTQGGLVSKWGYPVAGNATGNSWIMYMKTGDLVEALLSLDGSNTALTLTGNVTRTANTWQHYALERNDADVVRLYLDGNVIAQGNLSGTLYNNDPSPLIYGGGPTYLFSVLAGWRIDEVRITNGHAQYNGAFTPPTTPFPRINLSNVEVSTTNTFIKTENVGDNTVITTDTVRFSASGGDGTGATYGYIFKHELELGSTTGPVLTLSNIIGNAITVSANGSPGDSAAGNVITSGIDPTGFKSNVVNAVLLVWEGVSLNDTYSVSDQQVSTTSTSRFTLAANGNVIQNTQTSGNVTVDQWIAPTSSANSSYEVRATVVNIPTGGSVLTGTFDTWLDMGSDRSWTLSTTSGNGFGEALITVEIRLGGTVLDTANVSLDVESSTV